MIDRINRKYFLLAVAGAYVKSDSDINISVRCPVCGDSRQSKSKARLHLFHKNGKDSVNCFNGDCPVKSKSVYYFLHDFYPALLESYRREQFGNTLQNLASGVQSTDVFAHLKTEKPEQKIHPVVSHDLTSYFKNISEVPEALKYLSNRGIEYDKDRFGTWYFGFQNLEIGERFYNLENSIIIPLYYDGTMYGFYSRNISNKLFSTYMPEINIGYKIWNWFNVNKSQKVYIYEGIFDCISGQLDNSIALMGAKLPPERLAELQYPVFVLDNDRTGLKNSLEYCKKAMVYIQPDDFEEKDMNELMLNHGDINIPYLINSNLFTGISAEVRIKSKL